MSATPIRIAIVDDSPAMQELLSLLLGSQPDFEIAGVAGSAEEGWGLFCKVLPDVLLLDLELPGRPGIDLLKRIMRERPTPVMIVSANGGEGTIGTISALAAGAVAFIEKPDSIQISVEDFRKQLYGEIRLAAGSRQSLMRVAPVLTSQLANPTGSADGAPLDGRIVAIGASTGGVAAVQHVLTALNRAPLPIVVAQHMPPGYTRRFAERLQQVTGYAVKEAEDGDEVRPGRVLIAPGDRHLTIAGQRAAPICRLMDGPLVSGHKPSVDVLFASVAELVGPKAVGAILTGMGRDGADGLLAMRKAGARTVAESEASAVVYGMPKVALEMGAAEDAIPLAGIANWIRLACSNRPAAPPPPRPAVSTAAKDLRSKPIPAFRVLVVDDQKSMRGVAAAALQQLGFREVDEASSGEEALRAIGAKDYDLMLADWNMDGMSGIELLKAVRKERDQRQIVVVMTTSESHVSKVSEAMSAGANNYLVKPCDPPKLRQRLERALMRSMA
jgi:two-component system, chemotaxis family, protein-glutamate methylesterase/glutaminase